MVPCDQFAIALAAWTTRVASGADLSERVGWGNTVAWQLGGWPRLGRHMSY
jgi:hypothetical protein